jgi:hypothetical protein
VHERGVEAVRRSLWHWVIAVALGVALLTVVALNMSTTPNATSHAPHVAAAVSRAAVAHRSAGSPSSSTATAVAGWLALAMLLVLGAPFWVNAILRTRTPQDELLVDAWIETQAGAGQSIVTRAAASG